MKKILDNVMKLFEAEDMTRNNFMHYVNIDNQIKPQKDALKIAGIHGIFGLLYASFSSEFIQLITYDITTMERLELYKDWLYVVITVIMVYVLIKKRLVLLKTAGNKIIQSYEELNNAHKKMIEAEELSENIFNNAPIIIALSDFQGKVVKCNKYSEQVTGYSYKQLIGCIV